jgi:hypothetical protein
MITPLNPTTMIKVSYKYLFCLSSSERLWPTARRKARGLLSASSTLGTTGRQLHPINLDMTGSLQRQMAGELYTPY